MRAAGAEAAAASRYEVSGSLGAGGMGVVYRAFDRRARRDIALKTVRQAQGRDLYRFKREFRVLADIVHPNLVALHELHTRGDEWFFTMELVEGVPFIEWVRPPPHYVPRPADDAFDVTAPAVSTGGGRARREIIEARLDVERLAETLPQLVDAVLALHVCGKLHRDLKPSNVLVTPEGRVVVLDFGLVSDLDSLEVDRTHETAAVVGTPVYMSPEQACDEPLSEASDWYTVGVMLYEALTGQRPFEASGKEILQRKLAEDAPRARDLDPAVPEALDALCARLLGRSPNDRPDGRAILDALGRSPSRATLDLERDVRAGLPFVGRAPELAALRRALDDSRRHCVAVFLRGDSGTGKTRLARAFVDEIGGDALVLEGRCYERESVPFKALDTVIDALAGALLRLPPGRLHDLIPRDVAALARLFPVLRRVPSIAERSVAAMLPPDPQELRRRAFAALRELLTRLADLRPLAIVIDDLQWGDSDSAVFLAELVHHPEPLPVLLLLLHQLADDAGVVARVKEPGAGIGSGDARSLDLGPLEDGDALSLARSLGSSDETAASLVRETAGHPLFLVELARTAAARGDSAVSLEQLIAQRLAALPPLAAAVARTVAVAGRPLSLDEAAQASGLERLTSELSRLRAEDLVRMRRMGDDEAAFVETYHNRVRAAIIATMDAAERRRVHEALARTMEGDPEHLEGLVEHWLGAEQPLRAAENAVRAARAAEEALAFQRAADLYAVALRHGQGDAAARHELWRRRADALVNGGQLEAAAEAFAEAASGGAGEQALACERLQLEQLLRLGRLAEGHELARRVLAKVGHRLPDSEAAAIRALLVERARLRLRGLGFRERAEAEVPADVRVRLDVLLSVSSGLSLVEPLFGRLVLSRFLREALRAGEPRRICVGLAYELGLLGLGGVKGQRRIDAVAARVHELAARIGDRQVIGIAAGLEGIARYQAGRWKQSLALLETGIEAMREHGTGVRWELDVTEHFHIVVLFYLGETRELARRTAAALSDAVERGDVYAQRALRGWRCNLTWLILGRPDEARAHVDAVAGRDEDFHLQRYWELSSHAHIDLYVGEAGRAWERADDIWRRLSASHLRRLQSVRIEAGFLRARAALARALEVDAGERRSLVAVASTMARRLEREGAPWSLALAEMVQAMIAAVAGGASGARSASAAEKLAACDMRLFELVVRLRIAEQAGAARDELVRRGVADPDAVARMLCPWPAAAQSPASS